MKNSSRAVFVALILAAALFSMTACNKGYGCPTDFSLGNNLPGISLIK
jgi:predicted small secreted protein